MLISASNQETLCYKGSAKYNEDIIGINPYGAWVLDGATGLNKKNLISNESDAKWYVSLWNEYLYNNINKEKDLKEIILEGLKNIRSKYYSKIDEDKIEKLDTPSSSICVIKWNYDYIEYLLLGDCALHIKIDEEIKIIKDRTICKFDNMVYEKMEKLPNLKNLSFDEIKSSVIDTIIDNRLKKNTKDGYWILEFETEAIENAIYGKVNINKNIKLMLTSDGFSSISDRYNLIKEEELLNYVIEHGVSDTYKKLRKFEEDDYSTTKFPRFKVNDDSSCIYLELNKNG